MAPYLMSFAPVLSILAAAVAVGLAGRFGNPSDRVPARVLAAIGLTAAAMASVMLWNRESSPPGALVIDNYTIFFSVLVCGLGLLTVLAPSRSTRRLPASGSGLVVVLLLTVAAMMLVAASRDVVVLCLTLAAAWIGCVALTGAGHRGEAATEAALKVLICGAVSTAFLLFASAMVYAFTGATHFADLATRVAASSLDPNVIVLLAMALLMMGLAFALAAVPCHGWTGDVFGGGDAPVAGFMTAGLQAVAIAATLRMLLTAFGTLRIEWLPVLSAVAGLSMVVGTVAAVGQPAVRRLLACAGVAHGGYLLMGLAAASPAGKASVLFSAMVWGAASVVVCAVLPLAARSGHGPTDVEDLAGLGRERPALALLVTIGLLSVAGLPPSGGFIARWLGLGAALQEGLVALAVLGALSNVLLAFACVRPIMQMYLAATPAPVDRPVVSPWTLSAHALVAVWLIHAGVWPGWWLEIARTSAAALF